MKTTFGGDQEGRRAMAELISAPALVRKKTSMKLLERERADLERCLPGLDGLLAETSSAELERPGSPGVKMFRDAGGPALVIPIEYKGLGADPVAALDGVSVRRFVFWQAVLEQSRVQCVHRSCRADGSSCRQAALLALRAWIG